jgi:hypothetical protein
VDSYVRLVDSVPTEIEIKRLVGTMVWLRDGEHEWTGPAEQALALLGAAAPDTEFWTALQPAA